MQISRGLGFNLAPWNIKGKLPLGWVRLLVVCNCQRPWESVQQSSKKRSIHTSPAVSTAATLEEGKVRRFAYAKMLWNFNSGPVQWPLALGSLRCLRELTAAPSAAFGNGRGNELMRQRNSEAFSWTLRWWEWDGKRSLCQRYCCNSLGVFQTKGSQNSQIPEAGSL